MKQKENKIKLEKQRNKERLKALVKKMNEQKEKKTKSLLFSQTKK
ncbi:hypothetical protein [Tenacibaculum soleae]